MTIENLCDESCASSNSSLKHKLKLSSSLRSIKMKKSNDSLRCEIEEEHKTPKNLTSMRGDLGSIEEAEIEHTPNTKPRDFQKSLFRLLSSEDE